MSNDERREKRVQASLKVRYKSATVTEFIEKHCHDISPGGVFIRSQKPLARGSLLKIDFRLEDDTAVIQGVGRVVWTREATDDPSKPAGMGIKFVRLDDSSKDNIHKIIAIQKSGSEITKASLLGSDDDTDDLDAMTGSTDAAESKEYDYDSVDESENTEDNDRDESEPTNKFEIGAGANDSSKNVGGRRAGGGSSHSGTHSTIASSQGENKSGIGLIIVLIAVIVLGVTAYLFFNSNGTDEQASSTDTPADSAQLDTSNGAQAEDNSAVAPSSVEPPADTTPPETDTETSPATEPASEPAVPLSGEVVIRANIDGAMVTVDGVIQEQKTPCTLPGLPAGDHTVVISRFGYQTAETSISCVENTPLEVSIEVKPARFVTTIKANVFGARIFIGDKQIGRTPVRTVKRFEEPFEILVQKPGYKEYTQPITEADWTYADGVYSLELNVELQAVDAADAETPDTASTSTTGDTAPAAAAPTSAVSSTNTP